MLAGVARVGHSVLRGAPRESFGGRPLPVPLFGRRPNLVLDLPVLSQLLATPVGSELENEAAEQRDPLAFLRPRCPPLDRGAVSLLDRRPQSNLEAFLRGRGTLPIRQDLVRSPMGFAERSRIVDGILGEQTRERIRILLSPTPEEFFDPHSDRIPRHGPSTPTSRTWIKHFGKAGGAPACGTMPRFNNSKVPLFMDTRTRVRADTGEGLERRP
jgi:hypothetical protein